MVQPWTDTEEQAYQWLHHWVLARYENPVESCPYESAEGGFQFIWGGPYDLSEVLETSWADVFTEAFCARVATRLEEEEGCYTWSAVPDE